jgi:hypothetical protein
MITKVETILVPCWICGKEKEVKKARYLWNKKWGKDKVFHKECNSKDIQRRRRLGVS